MAANIETIDIVAQKYVADVKRVMPIDKAVLYGSHAKGTATEKSDVDICFFSKEFEKKRSVEVVIDLLGIAGKYHPDFCFEPRAFPTSEIENDNPFVREVLRTGREIV